MKLLIIRAVDWVHAKVLRHWPARTCDLIAECSWWGDYCDCCPGHRHKDS